MNKQLLWTLVREAASPQQALDTLLQLSAESRPDESPDDGIVTVTSQAPNASDGGLQPTVVEMSTSDEPSIEVATSSPVVPATAPDTILTATDVKTCELRVQEKAALSDHSAAN